MQNLQQQSKVNPLASLMRQPKLSIKLPSQGRFWPAGSLNTTANGEYKVFSMTAKDELLLRNPATQTGGQSLVDVIHSCIPDIRDAWGTPGLDLDAILIAIRIATYGPTMQVSTTVEGVEGEYTVNLIEVLDSILENASWDDQFVLDNGMIVFINPISYKDVAKAGQENAETQKIMNLVNNDKIDEEKKVELFRESFVKLTDITLSVVFGSIKKIVTVDNIIVEDTKFIKEFMENADRDVFTKIRIKINELSLRNSIKPIKVEATPAMREAGAPEVINLPIEFTPANFFQ
jgi:hypothetical protein